MKTLAMNEGVGRHLDPGFNAVAVAAPFARRVMRRRLRPSAWEPEIRHGLTDLARVSLDMTGTLPPPPRQIERGELPVIVRPGGRDEPLHRLEAMVNRLAMSVLVAAFVVGSAVIITAYRPGRGEDRLGSFIVVGLVAASVLGFSLMLVI